MAGPARNPPLAYLYLDLQTPQFHGRFRLLNGNSGSGIDNVEVVNYHILLGVHLNLHQLQFPQLYLHRNVGRQIHGNSGLSQQLIDEHGDLGTGELSAAPGEFHVQQSGVLVALVEYRQGTRPEFRARIRNGKTAIIKITYADLFVGIPEL